MPKGTKLICAVPLDFLVEVLLDENKKLVRWCLYEGTVQQTTQFINSMGDSIVAAVEGSMTPGEPFVIDITEDQIPAIPLEPALSAQGDTQDEIEIDKDSFVMDASESKHKH